ncbi:hypothetical protein [uncultured Shewanella sp.]|uniref:hypothetical protein n=1 Tax=uncultured Shewanella sp. TaxID=173975 RepID=UPI00263492B9|nr:hypothetical protein [uncultured Shewanella sp.]
MAIIQLKSTGQKIAGGILDEDHARSILTELKVNFNDVDIIFTPGEILMSRQLSYSKYTDSELNHFMSELLIPELITLLSEEKQLMLQPIFDEVVEKRTMIKSLYPKHS